MLLKNLELKTTNWSGGTTTELYIYPTDSVYKRMDFSFRLSTATVEIESSEFTSLPGVSRTLMVLEGEMYLEHEGQHSILLHPFEQDHFKGDWTTRSRGKCVDFNLMTRSGTSGNLSTVQIDKSESAALVPKSRATHVIIYVVSGSAKIESDRTNELYTKDVFVIQKPFPKDIVLRSDSNAQLIIAEICVD